MSARNPARHLLCAAWMLVVLLSAVGLAEATESYRLSSTNTRVSFSVQRLGVQWVTARFPDVSGEFVLDRVGSTSRVDVTVGIASLESSEPRLSDRLRSAEWLDAERYPHMTYRSSSIELSEHSAIANGDLTLHGITRPVVLIITLLSCPAQGQCRFAAHSRIKRSEFALPHSFWSGGDQVDIAISGSVDRYSSLTIH